MPDRRAGVTIGLENAMRVSFLAAVIVAAVLVASAVGSTQASRWVITEIATPAARPAAATALNGRGQVVGVHGAGVSWMRGCTVAFLWQRGALKVIPADGCEGDLWRTHVAQAITAHGRVHGSVTCEGCNGAGAAFWLWPASPNPTNSRQQPGWQFGTDPHPAAGQRARTCWLAGDGRTVCGGFRGLPAVDDPVVQYEGCSIQDWTVIGVDDRGDVAAAISECVDANTGDTLAPRSSFLAGPGGWVSFGARGRGTIAALGAGGHVVGGIIAPGFRTHAFLWNGSRIVDLGTLGGATSVATALNGRDAVAGTSDVPSGGRHGFLWQAGGMIDIGAVEPVSVNARGEVLAVRTTRKGNGVRVFLWSGDRLHDLGLWRRAGTSRGAVRASGVPDYAVSLDDRGRVAGADLAGHAVVWQSGRRLRLPELPHATGSSALAVSATAGVVGWSTDAAGRPRAVVWTTTRR